MNLFCNLYLVLLYVLFHSPASAGLFAPPPPRFFTTGGAGCRVGGASEEAVVWEVTVKGGALEAGTKGG